MPFSPIFPVYTGTKALLRIFCASGGGWLILLVGLAFPPLNVESNLYLVCPAFHLTKLMIHVSRIVAPSDIPCSV
jgi:hypothetical protein